MTKRSGWDRHASPTTELYNLCRDTDRPSAALVRDPVHVHDFQATGLHLLALDHERLTYRFQGRQFRLTDIAGRVGRDLLA